MSFVNLKILENRYAPVYGVPYERQKQLLCVAATEFNRVHGNFFAPILTDDGYTCRTMDSDGDHKIIFSGIRDRDDDDVIDAACIMDEAITQFWNDVDFCETLPQKLLNAANLLKWRTTPRGLCVHRDDFNNVKMDESAYALVGRTDVYVTVGRLNTGLFLKAAADLAVQADIVAQNRLALGMPSILDGPR